MKIDLRKIWESQNKFVTPDSGEPLNEVKVVKATHSYLYVYKNSGTKIFVAKLKHGSVKQHADQLVDPPPGEYEPIGEIDPKTYAGPGDIMPIPGVDLPAVSRDPGKGGGKGMDSAKWSGKKSQKGQQTKIPDTVAMVPVFKYTKTAVWVFVGNPHAGGAPLLTKLSHKSVKKYKDKLTAPEGMFEYIGKIDPAVYSGPDDIFPLDWTPAQGVHGNAAPVAPVVGSFGPANSSAKAAVITPPAGWDVSIDPDPNGLPAIEHPKTGAQATLLPDGNVGQWDYVTNKYNLLKLIDGGKAVVLDDSDKEYSLDDVKALAPTASSPATPAPVVSAVVSGPALRDMLKLPSLDMPTGLSFATKNIMAPDVPLNLDEVALFMGELLYLGKTYIVKFSYLPLLPGGRGVVRIVKSAAPDVSGSIEIWNSKVGIVPGWGAALEKTGDTFGTSSTPVSATTPSDGPPYPTSFTSSGLLGDYGIKAKYWPTNLKMTDMKTAYVGSSEVLEFTGFFLVSGVKIPADGLFNKATGQFTVYATFGTKGHIWVYGHDAVNDAALKAMDLFALSMSLDKPAVAPAAPQPVTQVSPLANALVPVGCKLVASNPTWIAETPFGDEISYTSGKWILTKQWHFQMLMNGAIVPQSFATTGLEDPAYPGSEIGKYFEKPGCVAIPGKHIIVNGDNGAEMFTLADYPWAAKYLSSAPAPELAVKAYPYTSKIQNAVKATGKSLPPEFVPSSTLNIGLVIGKWKNSNGSWDAGLKVVWDVPEIYVIDDDTVNSAKKTVWQNGVYTPLASTLTKVAAPQTDAPTPKVPDGVYLIAPLPADQFAGFQSQLSLAQMDAKSIWSAGLANDGSLDLLSVLAADGTSFLVQIKPHTSEIGDVLWNSLHSWTGPGILTMNIPPTGAPVLSDKPQVPYGVTLVKEVDSNTEDELTQAFASTAGLSMHSLWQATCPELPNKKMVSSVDEDDGTSYLTLWEKNNTIGEPLWDSKHGWTIAGTKTLPVTSKMAAPAKKPPSGLTTGPLGYIGPALPDGLVLTTALDPSTVSEGKVAKKHFEATSLVFGIGAAFWFADWDSVNESSLFVVALTADGSYVAVAPWLGSNTIGLTIWTSKFGWTGKDLTKTAASAAPTAAPTTTAKAKKPAAKAQAPAYVPAPPIVTPAAAIQTAVPSLSSLTLKGSGAHLGGAGKKDIYVDSAGKEWLWKPAQAKGGSAIEPFRAYAQQAFSLLAKAVDPGHIPIAVDTDSAGKIGTVQGMIDLADPPTLKGVTPKSLSESEKLDVAGEHMLDWLMSQHDSHPGNMVRTKGGKILSIDKEQGFKYFENDELSVDYHPNAAYGEDSPFYNTFWKDWANNKFDFDPEQMTTKLKQIESISTPNFVAMVRAYAASNPALKTDDDRQLFLEKLVARKLSLRPDFERFLTDLYKKRTGKDGEFTFLKGWIETGGTSAAKFTLVDISAQQVASEQNIKVKQYAPTDGTPNLVPDKDPSTMLALTFSKETSKSKGEELLAQLGVAPLAYVVGSANHIFIVDKAQFEKGKVQKKVPIEEAFESGVRYWPKPAPVLLAKPNVNEIKNLATTKIVDRGGLRVTADGAGVEGQTIKVQKLKIGAKSLYRLAFKVRQEVQDRLVAATGGVSKKWIFKETTFNAADGELTQTGSVIDDTSGTEWTVDDVAIFLAQGSEYAYKSSLYVTMPRSGDPLARLRAALNHLSPKLGDMLFAEPTAEDQEVLKLSRLLWSFAPQASDSLNDDQRTVANLKKLLATHGIPNEYADSARSEEVAPGYSTYVLPGRWKRILPNKKWFPWQGIGSLEGIVSIMTTGLMGIHERNLAGIAKAGASYTSDVSSGSGDNSLLRVATENAFHGVFGGTGWGGFGVLVHPKVLDRLDAVMYNSDSFGFMKPGANNHGGERYDQRKPVEKKIESLATSFSTSNELLFRRAVDIRHLVRFVVPSEQQRKTVIKEALNAGVDSFNGLPVDDAVQIAKTFGDAWKYIEPLVVI